MKRSLALLIAASLASAAAFAQAPMRSLADPVVALFRTWIINRFSDPAKTQSQGAAS